MDNKAFSDIDICSDIILSQKYISNEYCNCALDLQDNKIKTKFLNIYEEEQLIENELFSEMVKRKWVKISEANKNKINEAKSLFSSNNE